MEDKRLNLKPSTKLMPCAAALVSAGENIITIAWTGIINSDPPMAYVSIRPERHSYGIVKEMGDYVINLVHEDLLEHVKYCGAKSGKDVDKYAETGLRKISSKEVKSASIAEAEISMECKVIQSFTLPTHEVFIGEIVNITCKEEVFDGKKINVQGLEDLLLYMNGRYFKTKTI